MSIQAPRGTRDILPESQGTWRKVLETAKSVSERMQFLPITVPTFEEVTLFNRSIGVGTDVIDKELFMVKGVRSEDEAQYALRPEGTAGIVRAYLQNGLFTKPSPQRLYSICNNFRYERPQKGRYREHTQISLEMFGDRSAFADVWVILTTYTILRELGLSNLRLEINTLGTKEERLAYIDTLKAYYQPHFDRLSSDSKTRLEINPLRILDSKDSNDIEINASAPSLLESLSEESRVRYKTVLNYLDLYQIPYNQNRFLVRGLDYYCHTAFEWTCSDSGGQQSSLGGGGRYDGLITLLGGQNVGAVGAGLGIDRLVELLEKQDLANFVAGQKPVIFLVAADSYGKMACDKLVIDLISNSMAFDYQPARESFGSQIKAAGKSGAKYAGIIGQTESEGNNITLKNLETGEQEIIALGELINKINVQ